MNIIYILKGTKQIKKLYIRIYQNKLDLIAFTGLQFTDEQWNKDLQSAVGNPEQNEVLAKLRLDVLSDFNKQFSCGGLIDRDWLNKAVNNSLNRPKGENKLKNELQNVYLSDFMNFWLENHADSWKISARKTMGSVLKSQYRKVAEIFSEYESETAKVELRKLNIEDLYGFAEFLEDQEYNSETIKRMISRLCFFCARCEELGFDVSPAYKQRVFVEKEDDLDKVYLTESEISAIAKKDFSFDPELDIAKQNLMILLHTGIRGGDFMKNLDMSKIDNDVIKIRTQKTGQNVVIPLHKTVKDIIRQNFGNLPPKMTLFDFNKAIKTICMLCDIDEVVEGKLFDNKKKRKVRGFYKKFELITSHSCRRGFATLYKGKVSDEAICSVLGWRSTDMLKHYNQTSKTDYANELQSYWNI